MTWKHITVVRVIVVFLNNFTVVHCLRLRFSAAYGQFCNHFYILNFPCWPLGTFSGEISLFVVGSLKFNCYLSQEISLVVAGWVKICCCCLADISFVVSAWLKFSCCYFDEISLVVADWMKIRCC